MTVTSPNDAVTFRQDEGVGWLTLNRPDAANARNQAMREAMGSLLGQIADSNDIKVVVLAAEGRHFCAGMDLKEAAGEESALERHARMKRRRDIEQLAELPQPTICAVSGAAYGGGLEMALACDIRIAAQSAKMALPEVKHGLLPGGGGTYRLPQLVGPQRAWELMYTGRAFDAAEAARMGVVLEVVEDAALEPAVAELAGAIASGSMHALRAIKESVRFGMGVPPRAAIEREFEKLMILMAGRGEARS